MTEGETLSDESLVYLNTNRGAEEPGTHVLIVGVGEYAFGRNRDESLAAGDLKQLSSPPISARAMADWFLSSFKNRQRPLASVSMVLSEATSEPYTPPARTSGNSAQPPSATLDNVKSASDGWAKRLRSHPDNMAVFYFCGHGASLGDNAALLLEDFGEPGRDLDGAIDLNMLLGMMENSPAVQQVFLLDCCRTRVDDVFIGGHGGMGSRIVTQLFLERGHDKAAEQFVLFPTLDGEEAFGVRDEVSLFSHSLIDAMSFAAADCRTGPWRTTTGNLFDEVGRLIDYRVPDHLRQRSKPNLQNGTSFDFNEIDEPTITRSFVTLSDRGFWSEGVEIGCSHVDGTEPSQECQDDGRGIQACCCFELKQGKWRFSGSVPAPDRQIEVREQTVSLPVAYVTLEVVP